MKDYLRYGFYNHSTTISKFLREPPFSKDIELKSTRNLISLTKSGIIRNRKTNKSRISKREINLRSRETRFLFSPFLVPQKRLRLFLLLLLSSLSDIWNKTSACQKGEARKRRERFCRGRKKISLGKMKGRGKGRHHISPIWNATTHVLKRTHLESRKRLCNHRCDVWRKIMITSSANKTNAALIIDWHERRNTLPQITSWRRCNAITAT